MKKILLLMMALVLSLGLKAQCPLTTAVDFTATDCHGTQVHLFDILDGGQYVLIDFFFTTCGPCQQATPKVVESYYTMGCNMHDIYYVEISDRDSDAACQTWAANYGVEYPTIGGPAGGGSICNTYQIGAFPTVILIAPDRQILIQDLWPINNAQTIVNALMAQGPQPHDCNASTYDPQVSIFVDQVLETEVTATFTPNEDCASYNYMLATEDEIQSWMGAAGMQLPEYLHTYGFPGDFEISHTFSDLTPETEYTIYALPVDPDGNFGEVTQESVITTNGGGSDIMPDFTAPDIDGNEIHLYDILDGGQAVLINFFLYGDEFSENIMQDVVEAYRLYGCNQNDVFFMEISPNGHDDECQAWAEQFKVEYPTISRDGGGNDIAQAIPVGFYPTLMLIRPDHTFAVRDIYPPTLDQMVQSMSDEGYEQYLCYDETLTFSTDTIEVNWRELTWITVYNNTAQDAVVDTVYSYFLTFTFDGTNFFSTLRPMEFTIPQGESIELGLYSDGVSKDVYWDDITLAGNLPDASFVARVDFPWSAEENASSFTVFPNPANESVTLKGENLGTVSVYNTLGQKVEEFVTEGGELTINTAKYENGVYVVKSDNGTVARFVVKH